MLFNTCCVALLYGCIVMEQLKMQTKKANPSELAFLKYTIKNYPNATLAKDNTFKSAFTDFK